MYFFKSVLFAVNEVWIKEDMMKGGKGELIFKITSIFIETEMLQKRKIS